MRAAQNRDAAAIDNEPETVTVGFHPSEANARTVDTVPRD
jgi:hypothetical protein